MKISEYIESIKNSEIEKSENVKSEKIRQDSLKEKFTEEEENVRVKIIKDLMAIASHNRGEFSFSELYNEDEIHPQDESEHQKPEEFKFDYDDKKTFPFSLEISASKFKKVFLLNTTYYRNNDNFNVYIELSKRFYNYEEANINIDLSEFLKETDLEELIVKLILETEKENE